MDAKPLQQADFETGMMLERRLAEAYEAFAAANQAYLVYFDILRERYNAPAGAWALRDWAEGFVREDNDE